MLFPQPPRRLPTPPVERRALAPTPAPSGSLHASPARVVGPGRLERGYRARISDLERTVATAELVERGSARLLDRVEGDLERKRSELHSERQQKNRLLVGLGALQRENESLRARVLELESASERPLALGAATAGRKERRGSTPARGGIWARMMGTFSRTR